MAAQGLHHGPLGENCLHICVDMQGLFAAGGPWPIPWMENVLPRIEEAVSGHARQTLSRALFLPTDLVQAPERGRATIAGGLM